MKMKGEVRHAGQSLSAQNARAEDLIISMSLKEEKQRRIEATFRFEKTDRIPTLIFTQGWSYDYAGVRRRDVLHDPAACAAAATKYLDDFDIDLSAFNDVNLPVYSALGCTNYYWAPNGSSVQHAQAEDHYSSEDKYPDYIANPMGYLQNEALKQRVPAFNLPREEAYEMVKKAAGELIYTNMITAMVNEKYAEKGVVNMFDAKGPLFFGPFTQIFDYFRGIKGALIDLRRRPDTVTAACDAYMAQAAMVYGYKSSREEVEASLQPGDLRMGMSILNSEGFLNPKQFDKYYMSYFRKYFAPYFEAGFTYFINGECDLRSIIDQFADLPKGAICMMLCQNHTEDLAPALMGKQTTIGGIHMEDLRDRTKEECTES